MLRVGPAQAQAENDEPGDAPSEETASDEEESDPAAEKARATFVEGTKLVKKAQWAEALAAFERSSHIKAHPVTTYNIGICLRALGQYVAAKRAFEQALREDEQMEDASLSETLRVQAKGFLEQLDGMIVRATVTMKPATAAIAVDGRPLERVSSDEDDEPVLVAGVLPPGKGTPAPSGTFELVMDPGARVITLSRRGYEDAIVNRTFTPGERPNLELAIDELPATLNISADAEGAVVRVDDSDVGEAPVTVSRREGEHLVTVHKEGFIPYETRVTLSPGETANITASLAEEGFAIHEEWWFWTSLAGVAASVAVTTFVVTRPEPERPPANGGGWGWVVQVP